MCDAPPLNKVNGRVITKAVGPQGKASVCIIDGPLTAPIHTTTQWEENWLSASVVNQHLVCDPSSSKLALTCHANHDRPGPMSC